MSSRVQDRRGPAAERERSPDAATVSSMGERALLARIAGRVPPPPDWTVLGIGDDAAVVEPERNQLEVLTTDIQVEGVHFDRRWASAVDIGFKALAVNLSDLAAMGATPRTALLSLALPDDLPVVDFDGLVDGVLELSARHGIALVGGNLSRSPGPLVVDVTVTGSVRRRRVLTRSGARPGDELYVTGSVGGAGAALAWLNAGARDDDGVDAALCDALARLRRPQPRLRIGQQLGRNRAASACVDLSDGLGDAVRQIAKASGVGAVVEGALLPIDQAIRSSAAGGGDALRTAIGAGEDYELLFSVSKKSRGRLAAVRRLSAGVPITRIGVVTPGTDLLLRGPDGDEPWPDGFGHF